MHHSRLEVGLIALGTTAITLGLVLTYRSSPVLEEAAALIMMVGVLYSAVRWGRNGGFVAAALASLGYVVIRIPLLAGPDGFTTESVSLIVTRAVMYGLVGIVGGELSRRLKYLAARSEGGSSVDEWSQVYNQRHLGESLGRALAQHQRYGMPLTVILIELSTGVMSGFKPSRQRILVRGVANHLRSDTRIVDEIGRLDDGRFAVLLPHTPKAGAVRVAERLRTGVADLLGTEIDAVTTSVAGTPDDIGALRELRDEIGPCQQ